MNEEQNNSYEITDVKKEKRSKAVSIVAIIATTIIILACIVACSIITNTFLMNAPW